MAKTYDYQLTKLRPAYGDFLTRQQDISREIELLEESAAMAQHDILNLRDKMIADEVQAAVAGKGANGKLRAAVEQKRAELRTAEDRLEVLRAAQGEIVGRIAQEKEIAVQLAVTKAQEDHAALYPKAMEALGAFDKLLQEEQALFNSLKAAGCSTACLACAHTILQNVPYHVGGLETYGSAAHRVKEYRLSKGYSN